MSTKTLAWDTARGIPFVKVSGIPPKNPPQLARTPPWIMFIGKVTPWVQLAIGVVVVLFGFVAHAGYKAKSGNSDEGKRLWLKLVVMAALVGAALLTWPPSMPQHAFNRAQALFEAAQAQAAKVEKTRAALATIFRRSANDGLIQPFSESDLRRVQPLLQPIHIDSVGSAESYAQLWAIIFLAPIGALFLFYPRRFLIGYDYLFRKHPAEPVVVPAIRKGIAIKASELADALTPDFRELELETPAFRHKHDAMKAQALKEKLDADAGLAEAAIQRERKRAELIRKRAEVEQLERELAKGNGRRKR